MRGGDKEEEGIRDRVRDRGIGDGEKRKSKMIN